ncbi:MAG: SRPBCC family protein [Cyclobacteriaceae bacterium]
MNLLKKVILILAIIIAIPLVAALFVKEQYTVEREIVINQPKQDVFNYLTYIKNMEAYSPWAELDLDMKRTYTGTDGTVGSTVAWTSQVKEVGSGEQEIKEIIDGKRINFELRFSEPFEARDLGYFSTDSVSETETKVVWGFVGKMKYPMNLMLLFMDFEQMIGDEFKKGLSNLKKVLE